MANDRVTEIQKKKVELENELARIHEDLDKSIDSVREEVADSLAPKTIVRKYPLHVLGASIIIGFLIGKPKSASSLNSSSLIASEIKKAFTKKGLSMLGDIIEGKINSREKE